MTGWIIETLVATTLLMALVLLLREPVRRAFGPNIAYLLWALPVCRMLLPALPGASQWSMALQPTIADAATTPVAFGALATEAVPPAVIEQGWVFEHAPQMALVPPSIVEGGAPILLVLVGIWTIGAIGFLGFHLLAHWHFCRRLMADAGDAVTVAGGHVRMIRSPIAHGPLAFGIWRKYVAFPADFDERYDELERDLALAHELGHHARGDLIANWVALAMLGFHWFNPVAWRAYRAFRADQEMACDALVLSDRHPALRHAYGRAIVKSAHGGAVSAACHLHSVNEIKGRLRMLTKHSKPSRGRRMIGAAGIGALTLAGLALTASGTAAADELRAGVETRIGMPLDEVGLSMPEMPEMPEMPDMPAIPASPEAVAAPFDAPFQLADVPLPPPSPPVPVFPPVPAEPTAPVPPMPPIPPAAVSPPWPVAGVNNQVYRYTRDGKTSEIRRIERTNGSEREVEVTEIREGRCGEGTSITKDVVEGNKRIVTICADRAKMTAELAAKATQSAWLSKATALSSLKIARRSIESQEGLGDQQRRKALAGIEKALAELQTPD
ncbi:M56 family metallopeptidase [Sphingomonas sp. 37zxx]|uniref:M56 family metallopeptidase n=1 Tax=Sphingomonas sp. 37zxx TaxID=1550073 RepID=UPI00053BDFCB|nr:M56 family metallopeptidase [Sphingomonas sp. 37zxx]